MRAQFGRKVANLEQLEEITSDTDRGESFVVDEIIKLDRTEWRKLTADFIEDYAWMAKKGGTSRNEGHCGRKCLLVFTADCDRALLIDPQGYTYARYVAVVDKESVFAKINA